MLRMKWMTDNGGRLTARWADEERRIPSCRSETLSKEPVKQGGPPGGLAQSFAAGTEDFCRMELPVHAGVQVHPESSGVTMLALRRALRLLHWAVLLACLLPCSRLWGQDQDTPTAQPSGSNQEIPSGSPWSLHFQATPGSWKLPLALFLQQQPFARDGSGHFVHEHFLRGPQTLGRGGGLR
jgi:hypothetical protein